MILERQGILEQVSARLNLRKTERNMVIWHRLLNRIECVDKQPKVRIGFVGKYLKILEAYHSVTTTFEICKNQGFVNIELVYIESEHLEPQFKDQPIYK